MPAPTLGREVPLPRLVPPPLVAVNQVTVALVPPTPFAVSVVVVPAQIGLATALTEVMLTPVVFVIVILASTGVPQSPVTRAK